jgi:putative acetyltransferase
MNTIPIREFRDGDEAALHKIFYSAVHEVASADYTSEQLHAWAPADMDLEAWYIRVRKNRPFVAVKEGEIVGFADLQEDGYIDQFFVSARYSRRGIGGALMKHIDQLAVEKGLSQLTSDVSRTAEPFFHHFGFEVVERRLPIRYGVALPNALMRKHIAANLSLNPDGHSGRPLALPWTTR